MVQRVRVLVENNSYAPHVSGGAELSVQGIAEGLVQRGHSVCVLTVGDCDSEDELNGVTVIRRRFAGLMSYFEHRAAHISVKKLINKPLMIDNPANKGIMDSVMAYVAPDVVLSNNLLGVTPEIWRAARRAGVPIMHTTRDCALMCPNSVLMCKFRTTCERPLPHCELMRRHLRAASRLVDVVSAPSSYALDLHTKDGYFVQAHTCVIPNAVRFDKSKVARSVRARELNVRQGPLRVCYLGRLVHEKGILQLVSALCDLWAQGVEAELHIAGKGPLEERLREYASQGIPLYLHGFLGQDGVDSLLMDSDVLVAPSLCGETFGRVVLDAYAHAMPAIVSDAGALPEVLQKGTGAVVPADDVDALATALLQYARNPSLVREQGIRGAQALGRYTIERQVDAFEEKLLELVHEADGCSA